MAMQLQIREVLVAAAAAAQAPPPVPRRTTADSSAGYRRTGQQGAGAGGEPKRGSATGSVGAPTAASGPSPLAVCAYTCHHKVGARTCAGGLDLQSLAGANLTFHPVRLTAWRYV